MGAFLHIISRLATVALFIASFYIGYYIAVGHWKNPEKPVLSKIIGFSVMFGGMALSILMIVSFWDLRWAGT